MGNLNIELEGYVNRVAEFMIKEGYVKTKTEALRLALFEFDKNYRVVPDEDTAFELAAKKILDNIESGKEKVKKFSINELK